MAFVIDTLGKEVTPLGVSVLGVCEIENRLVLEDLVSQPAIADKNYQIVHHEGPDPRGIDCALLYDPTHFKLTSSKSVKFTIPGNTRFRSRDQLVVSGELLGKKFILLLFTGHLEEEEKLEVDQNELKLLNCPDQLLIL